MMLLLIIVLTFFSLALMVMSLYWLFARPQSTVTARLETIDPSLVLVENNPMTTMAERVAEPLNRIVPLSAVEAQKLQKKMLQAGYRSPDAAMAFRAIQLSLVVAFPSIVLTICFMLDRPVVRRDVASNFQRTILIHSALTYLFVPPGSGASRRSETSAST